MDSNDGIIEVKVGLWVVLIVLQWVYVAHRVRAGRSLLHQPDVEAFVVELLWHRLLTRQESAKIPALARDDCSMLEDERASRSFVGVLACSISAVAYDASHLKDVAVVCRDIVGGPVVVARH